MRPPQLVDPHGRSAIVTGGASGLGRVAALALAEAGASVAITSRDASKLRTAVAELSRIGTVVASSVMFAKSRRSKGVHRRDPRSGRSTC